MKMLLLNPDQPVSPVVVERALSYFDGPMQIHKSLKIDKKYRLYFEGLS
jgi:hypothetical protein